MPKLNYNLDDIPDAQVRLIPKGRYRGILKKVEKTTSSTGNPMYTWDWRISGGPESKTNVRSWTSLLPNALSGLKEHLLAVGASGRVKGSTDQFLGTAVCLVIGQRKGTNRMGEPAEFTSVLGVLPISKLKKGVSVAAKKRKRPVDDEDDEDEEDEDGPEDNEDDDDDDDNDDDDDDDEDEDDDD